MFSHVTHVKLRVILILHLLEEKSGTHVGQRQHLLFINNRILKKQLEQKMIRYMSKYELILLLQHLYIICLLFFKALQAWAYSNILRLYLDTQYIS